MTWEVRQGDALEVLAALPEASVDAVVCDPPYGLEFMGKEWDGIGRLVGPGGKRRERETWIEPRVSGKWRPGSVYGAHDKNPRCMRCKRLRFDHEPRKCRCDAPQFHARRSEYGEVMQRWHREWAEAARSALKPGAYLVAFGGTRTYHRLVCALEDAGFEIRDGLMWIHGQGMPKGLSVARAVEMDLCELPGRHCMNSLPKKGRRPDDHVCPSDARADPYRGRNTALRPAWEPIALARKPLAGSVARNVQAHGTGALNVEKCRVSPADAADVEQQRRVVGFNKSYSHGEASVSLRGGADGSLRRRDRSEHDPTRGRWPPNLLLSHGPDCGDACAPGCPVAILDAQSGNRRAGASLTGDEPRACGFSGPVYGSGKGARSWESYGDSGGASRFYPVFDYEPPFLYCPKAGSGERDAGLAERSTHPTVKPVALMQWLCRLVTPRGGLVLDPFAGSGSTGVAALRESLRFLGIERKAEYVEIARRRIEEDAPLFQRRT